ncbi:cellulase family glycosylhydrolase [Sulfolobus islandicus]|uniref:mannan endo-1,4-beta-mannosidase n=1 Tax=Saccharolobus islandicus (strain HVE10/4) TaxID=930943 RepID=F0NLE0_SACI0|nr:cellulase family glycosylhydrolase [Sulfolobus islandicus]ADX83632.1 glycoside hydrolase family 42 protein [Sulfolobus islandicus HVE10/4]WCM37638.1 cellulase family glycosylhydrolase [Sulfolobus islandicus]
MKKFILGFNYWPRISNIKMWSRFEIEEIKRDFELMSELGINTIRAFVLDEDCADQLGNLKHECKGKIGRFLEEAERHSIKVLLTLIVGHMSGKNWGIPWDIDNTIYDKIEQTKRFIGDVVNSFKQSKAIMGWILTNEISLVRVPQNDDVFLRWLKELYSYIKGIDDQHVVSVGDNVSPFSHNFLRPENVKGIVDYASPHIYLYDQDPVRHSFQYFMTLEYDQSSRLPVILEEFGFPTSLYSEESHAKFIGLILRGALVYGADGALIWCFSDFPREGDEPYLWEPHELTFGVIRQDGSEKIAAKVVKDFSSKIKDIELSSYKVPKRDSAILVPSWFYRNFQFVYEQNKRWDFARVLNQAFTFARLSNIQVTFAREEDENLSSYKLLIIPSVTRLLTTTWRKLLKVVENGSTIYFSTYTLTHLSATHLWEELFGVIPSNYAGSKGVKVPERIRLDNNIYELGQSNLYTYSFKEKDAKVIGVDDSNNGVIFIAKRGKGNAILSTIPLELISSNNEIMDKRHLSLYNYIGRVANIEQSFPKQDFGVEIQYLEGKGESLIAVLNHTWEDKEYELNVKIKEDMDSCQGVVRAKSGCLMRV